MSADPTPLQERIARALCIEASEQEDGALVWGDAEDLAAAFEEEVEGWERFAAAVLPIIATEVRKGQAEALRDAAARVLTHPPIDRYGRVMTGARAAAKAIDRLADEYETGDQA